MRTPREIIDQAVEDLGDRSYVAGVLSQYTKDIRLVESSRNDYKLIDIYSCCGEFFRVSVSAGEIRSIMSVIEKTTTYYVFDDSEPIVAALQKAVNDGKTFDLVVDELVHDSEAELYDAEDDCDHVLANGIGGGVVCIYCYGWFCY